MRIGIIGAGQLGQMLGFAAHDLGMQCYFLDPSPRPPAAACGPVIRAGFDDADALAELADCADIVTFEFENIPVAALTAISEQVPVYPPPAALHHAQDRLAEKLLLQDLAIPLPDFHAVASRRDLDDAVAGIGLPLVLKTRRFGYDGKGQCLIRQHDAIDAAWQELGQGELIAEAWVDFDFEVSAIAARNADGAIIHYPLTQNEHADGILRFSRAPLQDDRQLAGRASEYMTALLTRLDYVGVLALELFVAGERLLANEFAPRVHNSGHWTIEGAVPSQFTAHLLAISNRPLVVPQLRGHAGMLNLIGNIPPAMRGLKTGTLHDYGKEPRPGRKLGHVTVVADSAAERERLLAEIGAYVS